MKFWILALTLPGLYAVTESMWKSSGEEEYNQVFVKSICDDGRRTLVTVRGMVEEDQSRKTFQLCASSSDEDRSQLQMAFERGDLVSLQFEGQFSRCISKANIQ